MRRLTDESTNEDCTPPGGVNAPYGNRSLAGPVSSAARCLTLPQARTAGRSRLLAAAVRSRAAVLAALAVGACGDERQPVEVRLEEETADADVLGFPALATKNTTRVGGEDPVADAAAVATAVYPGRRRTAARRP